MTASPSAPSRRAGARARTSQVPPDDFDPEPRGTGARILIAVSVGLPFLALLAAVPLAWNWGLGWHDIVIGGIFYVVSGLGVTVGFHRYFTHRSFKAVRSVHIALAVAGSLAMEGPVLNWVANHRRHHKYSDRDGDPHSPWRFGTNWKALAKGLAYAHIGWYFDPNQTSQQQFCPDLPADRGIRRVSRAFPLLTAASLLLPPLAGGRGRCHGRGR
jgi:stearoyl-CoA desaturase (delta-9 desaturase)